MVINVKTMIESMLVQGLSIKKYESIMENFNKLDVSNDKQFQKTFNNFYRVRRNQSWREEFFQLFEESKNKNSTFEEIIIKIFDFLKY